MNTEKRQVKKRYSVKELNELGQELVAHLELVEQLSNERKEEMARMNEEIKFSE